MISAGFKTTFSLLLLAAALFGASLTDASLRKAVDKAIEQPSVPDPAWVTKSLDQHSGRGDARLYCECYCEGQVNP